MRESARAVLASCKMEQNSLLRVLHDIISSWHSEQVDQASYHPSALANSRACTRTTEEDREEIQRKAVFSFKARMHSAYFLSAHKQEYLHANLSIKQWLQSFHPTLYFGHNSFCLWCLGELSWGRDSAQWINPPVVTCAYIAGARKRSCKNLSLMIKLALIWIVRYSRVNLDKRDGKAFCF